MDKQALERRRLLQLCILGALALPVVALAGCAGGKGDGTPPRRRLGGGGGSQSKGGGGPGGN